MTTIFSGNQEKKIPKNFKECYKTDSITQNLWLWCERLEKWGKILFWILLIGGLILSIRSSIVEKEVVVREATYWSDAKTEVRTTFDFELFIPLLLDTALYAFLEYCAYHIIALLIGSLASIVQNTKITANIALYNSAKAEGVTDDYDCEVTENKVVHKENTTKKCSWFKHQIYIDEVNDMDADGRNAHWELDDSAKTKTLVCDHCHKSLIVIKNFDEKENIVEKKCPCCNRKLKLKTSDEKSICPFCHQDFSI